MTPTGQGQVTIKPGGRAAFHGPGVNHCQLPILNQGGEFWVLGGVTANVTGRIGDGPSVRQDSGTTYIQGGSILAAFWGALFSGGKLSTSANTGGGSQVATIDSVNVTNTGADVVIGDGSSPHVTGTLLCTGTVNWTGGTYRPVIDGQAKTCDVWRSQGKFTVGQGVALAPGTINGGNILATDVFLFLEGLGTIEGTPPVPTGGVNYTVVTEGNPVTKWYFKKR